MTQTLLCFAMSETIHHIATEADWNAALKTGLYRGPTLDSEGFIHCSTREQLSATVARHFAGMSGLVLLWISAEAVESILKWEDTSGHGVFPHLYGELPTAAVIRTSSFAVEADGAVDWTSVLS